MSKYFSTSKRGELQELKSDLSSTDFTKKKEAIKKVIAQMTVGKDVSSLFQSVIRCLEYPQADIKKLVYLYIINYSRKKQEDAIMVIQPLRKDVAQGTPLIKALALRTMGCLRVEALNEYLQGPVKEGIEDRDAYVRKTAVLCVPKVYELNPKLIEEAGLITKMQKMLKRESNPVVIANVMIALYEISQMSDQSVLNIEPMVLQRLLNCINECIEWGQVFILDCLANYIPKDLEETEKIMERIYPRLQHINSSVVFSAVKVLVKYMDYVTNPELIRIASKKIAQPLASLINHEFPEIQYVILRNIHYLIQKRPAIFDNMIKAFFCKFNEPYYIKNEKIEILVKLCSVKNCEMVLNELKECTKDVDIDFAIKSIKAVGMISLNFEKFIDKSIEILMELIKDAPQQQPPPLDIIQEVMIATVNIYRKYPSKIYCENSLKTVAKYFSIVQEPQGKAAAIWILGEYAEKIENSVGMISEFIENFVDDERVVQLAILTATVKIFLKYPTQAEGIISSLLKTATESVETPDVRDRAFIYWRMLSSDPEKTKQSVLSDKPVLILEIPSFDTNFLDTMISNLALVSSVAQKTPEEIFKRKVNQIVRVEDQDNEVVVPVEQAQGENVVPQMEIQFQQQQQQQQIQEHNEPSPQNFMDMDLLDLDGPVQQQQAQKQQSPPKQQQSQQQTSFDLFDLDLTEKKLPVQEQQKQAIMDDDEDLFSEAAPQFKPIPYNLCVNFSQQGKGGISGLKIEGKFIRNKNVQYPLLELQFTNQTNQSLNSYVIQLKKNYFNIGLEKNSDPNWQGVSVNQSNVVKINGIQATSLATDEEKKDIETQQQLKFSIAFKCNLDLYFFEIPCSLFNLFQKATAINLDSFINSWNAISPKNMIQLQILQFYQNNYSQLNIIIQLLEEVNCVFVNSSTNSQNQTKAKFYAQVLTDQIFFELTFPLENGKGGAIHAKSQKNYLLNFFSQAIQEYLAK